MAETAVITPKEDLEYIEETGGYPEIEYAEKTPLELRNELQKSIDAEQISSLDPDFLAMALPLAIILDIMAIIAALLYFTVIAPIISTVASLTLGIILTIWMLWRTGRMDNAVARAQEILAQAAEGKGKIKTAVRVTRFAYMFRKRLMKMLIRFGLASVANIVPFLGFIPFWTIFVWLTFQEKRNLLDRL